MNFYFDQHMQLRHGAVLSQHRKHTYILYMYSESIQISIRYVYIIINEKAQNWNIVDVLSSFRRILYDIRMLSRTFIQFCFVSHLDNSVADGLAKSTFCLLSSSYFVE